MTKLPSAAAEFFGAGTPTQVYMPNLGPAGTELGKSDGLPWVKIALAGVGVVALVLLVKKVRR